MLKNTYIFLVQIHWKFLPMFRKLCLEKLFVNVQIESHVVRTLFFGLQVKHRKFSYVWFSAEKSPNRVFAVLQDKMLIFDVWTDFMVFNVIPMKSMSPLWIMHGYGGYINKKEQDIISPTSKPFLGIGTESSIHADMHEFKIFLSWWIA